MERSPVSSTADIKRVFALQRAHQWEAKASTAEQRKEKLRKLKAAVEAHADEIIAAVRQDTRKPENEVRVTEVLNVLGNIDRNIANLDDWMKPVEVSPSWATATKLATVATAKTATDTAPTSPERSAGPPTASRKTRHSSLCGS